MSGSRHTPGPWRTDGEWVYPNDDWDLRYDFSAPGEDGSDEQKANAYLIAAAPDLLEALKEIEQASTWCMHFACMEPIGRLTDIARAAIAHAEGRES